MSNAHHHHYLHYSSTISSSLTVLTYELCKVFRAVETDPSFACGCFKNSPGCLHTSVEPLCFSTIQGEVLRKAQEHKRFCVSHSLYSGATTVKKKWNRVFKKKKRQERNTVSLHLSPINSPCIAFLSWHLGLQGKHGASIFILK